MGWEGPSWTKSQVSSHTVSQNRYLVDLRPKELQAFSDRVVEIARVAGFAPHTTTKPSETFARFYKLGDSTRGVGDSAVESGSAPSKVLTLPPESISPPQADQAPFLEAVSPTQDDQAPSLESMSPTQDDQAPSLEAISPPQADLAPSLKVTSPPQADQAPSLELMSPIQADQALPLEAVSPPQDELVLPLEAISPPQADLAPPLEVMSPLQEALAMSSANVPSKHVT